MKAIRPSGAISAAAAGRHARLRQAAGMAVDEDGQDDHDPRVAGQPGDAGTQRRRHPEAPRQGEETQGGRREEEPLGVAERQDVGGWAEDVEKDRAVSEACAEDFAHGEPDGEGGGEPEREGCHDRGVGQAQPRHLGQDAHRPREAREERPAAAVGLVEQTVGVAVLRDPQIPGAVPHRAHGPDNAQPRVHGCRDQRDPQEGNPREHEVGGGAEERSASRGKRCPRRRRSLRLRCVRRRSVRRQWRGGNLGVRRRRRASMSSVTATARPGGAPFSRFGHPRRTPQVPSDPPKDTASTTTDAVLARLFPHVRLRIAIRWRMRQKDQFVAGAAHGQAPASGSEDDLDGVRGVPVDRRLYGLAVVLQPELVGDHDLVGQQAGRQHVEGAVDRVTVRATRQPG